MGDRIPDVSARVVEPADVETLVEGGRTVLRRERFGPIGRAFLRLVRQPSAFTIRLDRLASRAWSLFDGKRTVGEVRAMLQAEFPDEPDIGPRLGRLVGTLVSHQMVRLR
jgi:hypothetical protein